MNLESVISSYQKNFKSPLGAYVYMLLNQTTPEFFVLSSNIENELGEKLEFILKESKDLNSIIKAVQLLPIELFNNIENEMGEENDLSKNKLLQNINNLNYIDINFNKKDSWNELSGFIEYNKYGNFIEDKQAVIKELNNYAQKFSMASISLNPNFKPLKFLEEFEKSANIMCEALDINPKQIGLGVLNLNY